MLPRSGSIFTFRLGGLLPMDGWGMPQVAIQANAVDGAFLETLAASLRSAGVELADASSSTRIVAVGRVDETATRSISAAASRSHHVLVVARDPAVLQPAGAWPLLAAGGAEVLVWSGAAEFVREVVARLSRWEEVDRILRSPVVRDNLVGRSAAWTACIQKLVEVACFSSAAVLLLGESGTGKELAARLIHTLDRRDDKKALVILDCSTIVPELSGSEFFGHERGAFTGAIARRDGAIELAMGGTLFLDEIGELSPAMQAQLLRAVQERMYKRVGGTAWQRSEFRLISATNRDLLADAERGRFRPDLYHRMATWVCRLPPLRARRDDILPLARHFLVASLPELDPRFDPDVEAHLLGLDYPGNVRELQQRVRRMAERHVGSGPISPGDVPEEDRPVRREALDWRGDALREAVRRAIAAGAGLKEIGREASEAAIRLVLDEEQGNLQRAARKLGVTDRALQLRRRTAGATLRAVRCGE